MRHEVVGGINVGDVLGLGETMTELPAQRLSELCGDIEGWPERIFLGQFLGVFEEHIVPLGHLDQK